MTKFNDKWASLQTVDGERLRVLKDKIIALVEEKEAETQKLYGTIIWLSNGDRIPVKGSLKKTGAAIGALSMSEMMEF